MICSAAYTDLQKNSAALDKAIEKQEQRLASKTPAPPGVDPDTGKHKRPTPSDHGIVPY